MKRSDIEIRADILNAVNNGVESKTKIMYMASCNWKQIGNHLNYALDTGLLESRIPAEGVRKKDEYYSITGRGKEYLGNFKVVTTLLGMEDEIFTSAKAAKAANKT
jgi:predicted transcriptional regulator